jgi:hypothetical protein
LSAMPRCFAAVEQINPTITPTVNYAGRPACVASRRLESGSGRSFPPEAMTWLALVAAIGLP